jgi:acetyl esterase/lipase
VLFFYSSTEILRDDTLRMAEKLRAAGGDVVCTELAGAPHVWPLFDGYISEARTTLQEVAAFVDQQIAARRFSP